MSTSIRFEIDGLNCAGCAGRAETALAQIAGVSDAAVSIADKTGRVTLDDAAAADIHAALKQAGYPARETVINLHLDGLSCAGCAGRVERALAALPGVLDPGVNFADRSARVLVLSGSVSAAQAVRAVRDAGYSAAPVQADEGDGISSADQETRDTGRQALTAAILTLPVFLMEMGGHIFPALHHWIAHSIGLQTAWAIQFVLTTLVLAVPGRVFLRRGVPSLLRGHPDMNSLVALGSGAAWLYSTTVLLWPGLLPASAQAVYFEAAAVIVTLILVGRWLEARARGQAGTAIRALAGLQPDTALVQRPDGPVACPIAEITVGDLLHLRPGERVAVDGVITEGQSRLDESMITGEPGTVLRQPGDTITAGTVNGSGALVYRADRVGADTVLARIIDMVRQAQGAKLPVQSLADRVVARFVPAVLGIAVLTLGLWLWLGPEPTATHALVAAVSVLIIACPCAMGLATPTSIMAGTGRAAQLGVLFRKGEALQKLEEVGVVAFDKTGTLTMGQPRLAGITTIGDIATADILRLAASAEARSEHPLAHALLQAARDRGISLTDARDVQAIDGLGLSARVGGKSLLIGSRALMIREALDIAPLQDAIQAGEDQGHAVVVVAVDGQPQAVLTAADTVKPQARAVIAALHARGLKTAMITGDSARAASAIGAQLGITDIRAEVLPGEKKDAVAGLQDQHGPVVFVGDGINDAPALAAAHVGVAMGTGTDVAIQSADVVLVSGALPGVLTALDLSRRTMRNIRQNLFWAFGYNVTLIPVAAGLFYPVSGLLLSPMLAAGAMALSSVFVVTNALRLRRFSPDRAPGRPDPELHPVAAE